MTPPPRELSSPEKAVLLLLSLEEGAAAPIVAELSTQQVRVLRETAANMKTVPSDALAQVYRDFLQESGHSIAMPQGRVGFFRRVAAKALGEDKAQDIFGDRPLTKVDRVAQAPNETLAGLLEKEDPQLTAALLSQFTPEKAAAIVELLPEEERPAVLTRLGAMTQVPSDLVEEIANALIAELPDSASGNRVPVDGVSHSAALVRSLSKETCELLLGDVEAENEVLAAEIRQAMYSFEDLKLIDARSMRELLKAVPGDRLTLALKTASDSLTTHIFSGMSKRAAERIKEDLALLGSVRLADVEAAQKEVVEVALRLDAEGTLSLGSGGGDDFV